MPRGRDRPSALDDWRAGAEAKGKRESFESCAQVEWLEAKPKSDAPFGEIGATSPGTFAAAWTAPPSGKPLGEVSMRSEWESLHATADGRWIHADASAHRIVPDGIRSSESLKSAIVEAASKKPTDVAYESLVSDREGQTKRLLEQLGLPFEKACQEFHQNITPSNTASAVQVREKMHVRSVNRWQHFAVQLRPLQTYLANAGIALD